MTSLSLECTADLSANFIGPWGAAELGACLARLEQEAAVQTGLELNVCRGAEGAGGQGGRGQGWQRGLQCKSLGGSFCMHSNGGGVLMTAVVLCSGGAGEGKFL